MRTDEKVGAEIFEVELNLTDRLPTVNQYHNTVTTTNTDQLFDRQQHRWPASYVVCNSTIAR